MPTHPPLYIKDLSSTKRTLNINPDLPEPPFCMCVVGPSRAGKSNFIRNLLSRDDFLKKIFKPENIFIICPSLRYNDDYDCVDKAFKCDEFTNAIIDEIIEEQTWVIDNFKKERAPNILIVLDDIADNVAFSNSNILKKLAMRGRHMKISIIMSVQKFSTINKGVRINSTHIVMFRPNMWTELDFIVEQIATKGDRKKLMKIFKDIFRKNYAFIMMDLNNPDISRRLRKGMSEIIEYDWFS